MRGQFHHILRRREKRQAVQVPVLPDVHCVKVRSRLRPFSVSPIPPGEHSDEGGYEVKHPRRWFLAPAVSRSTTTSSPIQARAQKNAASRFSSSVSTFAKRVARQAAHGEKVVKRAPFLFIYTPGAQIIQIGLANAARPAHLSFLPPSGINNSSA